MEILIVDDEQIAIQGISMIADWGKLGIDKIWTALSIAEARAVLTEEKIDILLCDIEMRNENGLYLIDWVRKNYEHVKCIVVTGHVNFAYTRKSVELHVTDYLSKPVQERQLSDAIRKAAAQIRAEEEKNIEYSSSRAAIESQFFRRLLQEERAYTRAQIETEMKKQAVSMPVRSSYVMLFLKVREWNPQYDVLERKRVLFSMMTTLQQKYLRQIRIWGSRLSDDAFVVCFVAGDKRLSEAVRKKSEKFIGYCRDYFCCDVCVYIQEQVSIETFARTLSRMEKYDSYNLICNYGVLDVPEEIKQDRPFVYPDYNIWQLFLEEAAYDNLQEDIAKYIDSDYFRQGISPERMEKLIHDFKAMLVQFLAGPERSYDVIRENAEIRKLEQGAALSADRCRRWMSACIDGIAAYHSRQNREENVVDIICRYIDERPGEEISRDTLAELVYLSPDHMTRVFKKEKGMTITDYIVEQKMKRAAALLEKTEFSISYIAAETGYSNISHFSGAFKKMRGMTPSEYRKQKHGSA